MRWSSGGPDSRASFTASLLESEFRVSSIVFILKRLEITYPFYFQRSCLHLTIELRNIFVYFSTRKIGEILLLFHAPPPATRITESVVMRSYLLSILLTQPCETWRRRLISHGRTPCRAIWRISTRRLSGNGRPLVNMRPYWFTALLPACAATYVHNVLQSASFSKSTTGK